MAALLFSYAHMNEALKEYNVEVPAQSRHWDGYHSYDKRLVTLMSKDAGIKVTARRTVKTRKEANGAMTGAEDGEDENDGSQLPGRGRPKAKPSAGESQPKRTKTAKSAAAKPSKPQALPTRRSNRSTVQEGASRYAEEDSDVENDGEDDEGIPPAKSAQAGTNGTISSAEEDEEGDSDASEHAAQSGTTLPVRKGASIASKKRPRQAPEDEEDQHDLLPPPLAAQDTSHLSAAPSLPDGDLSATPASSRRGDSPEAVMDLSTQELAETDSLLDLPESSPGLNAQLDTADGLPRRKRSRY